MMRKLLPVLAAIALLAIVFGSFGCAAPAPATATKAPTAATTAPAAATTAPAPATPVKLPDRFIFGASGTGKAYDLSAFLSEMSTKYTPMKGAIEKVTSSQEAIKGVADGTYQSAVYSGATAQSAPADIRKNLRVLFCGAGPETSTIIAIQTIPASNIKTVADLKGKRVYTENPALVYFGPIFDTILKTNGMTRADIKGQIFNNATDAYRDLKEGRVDAMFYVTGASSTELGGPTGPGLYVVPLSPETQKAVEAMGTGFLAADWPAGMFGNKVTTPTLGSPNLIWSNSQLSEAAGYTFVQAVFEHLPELQASQKAAEGFTKENAMAQWAVPYHPGAIKYFKEIGVWKVDWDAKQSAALASWK
jgi:hypothetical protein